MSIEADSGPDYSGAFVDGNVVVVGLGWICLVVSLSFRCLLLSCAAWWRSSLYNAASSWTMFFKVGLSVAMSSQTCRSIGTSLGLFVCYS